MSVVFVCTTGCAIVPEPGPVAVPAPPAAAPAPVAVATTASGGDIASRVTRPALIDSAPSSQALDVLATIPDPIPAADRVPPPDDVLRDHPPSLPQPAAAIAGSAYLLADASGAPQDTTERAAAVDSAAADTAFIPVPKPTTPLGQRRRARPSVSDSLLRAAMGDTAAVDSGKAAAPVIPVHPDSCWRVQVAAPEEASRAGDLRRAAESLLLVPMVIEPEDGRYKVRTRDCLSAVTANRLRLRADASGFEGAFRFKRKR